MSEEEKVDYRIVDNSNPDDPLIECLNCYTIQGIWEHGCSEFYCIKCKKVFGKEVS